MDTLATVFLHALAQPFQDIERRSKTASPAISHNPCDVPDCDEYNPVSHICAATIRDDAADNCATPAVLERRPTNFIHGTCGHAICRGPCESDQSPCSAPARGSDSVEYTTPEVLRLQL